MMGITRKFNIMSGNLLWCSFYFLQANHIRSVHHEGELRVQLIRPDPTPEQGIAAHRKITQIGFDEMILQAGQLGGGELLAVDKYVQLRIGNAPERSESLLQMIGARAENSGYDYLAACHKCRELRRGSQLGSALKKDSPAGVRGGLSSGYRQ